jgi:1-acyl-sn-glycerol-3-phosphate acyltransferase
MTTVRTALRAAAVVLVTTLATGIVGLVDVFVWLDARGYVRLPGVFELRDWLVSLWGAACVAIVGVEAEVRGTVPERPFYMVSNHLSYLDIVLLQSIVPCVLVAKKAVRSWPGMGVAAAVGGTIFIDRRAYHDILRVNDKLEQALDRGQGVVIFPEGTSTDGQQVLDFRGSLLVPIAGTTQPVHYASISYRTPESKPPASTHVCWWGDMTFTDHVWELLQIGTVRATVSFGCYEPDGTEDRKELAAVLTERVRSIFVPSGTDPAEVDDALSEGRIEAPGQPPTAA